MSDVLTTPLRADLPPLPDRIRRLPVGPNGYPIPWFVPWIDGVPEFRVADGDKLAVALREWRCWVCGDHLGRMLVFVLGPMCAVNRISAEPPMHRECADFSLRACPFLSKPQMERRQGNRPADVTHAGVMIEDNPGCGLLWATRSYQLIQAGHGVLFRIGHPLEIVAYRLGQVVPAAELRDIFEARLPILGRAAQEEGPEAMALLKQQARAARALLFGEG